MKYLLAFSLLFFASTHVLAQDTNSSVTCDDGSTSPDVLSCPEGLKISKDPSLCPGTTEHEISLCFYFKKKKKDPQPQLMPPDQVCSAPRSIDAATGVCGFPDNHCPPTHDKSTRMDLDQSTGSCTEVPNY